MKSNNQRMRCCFVDTDYMTRSDTLDSCYRTSKRPKREKNKKNSKKLQNRKELKWENKKIAPLKPTIQTALGDLLYDVSGKSNTLLQIENVSKQYASPYPTQDKATHTNERKERSTQNQA